MVARGTNSKRLAGLFLVMALAGTDCKYRSDPQHEPPSCPTDATLCDDSCTNLDNDPRNCGACGHACPDGQVCSLSNCSDRCLGATQCGNHCVDTASDLNNCGACNHVCPDGQVCSLSNCSDRCLGATRCGDHCVDTASDLNNCGACNHVCPTGQVCSLSNCSDRCLGATRCGDRCVDTTSDPNNCGACNHVCSLPHSVPLCEQSICTVGGCDAGFKDLDGNPTNGCECAIGQETCDGVDNDCDGLVDGSIVNGRLVSPCVCDATPVIPASEVPAQLDTSPTTCGMTFCQRHASSLAINYCCDLGIFAQCHVEGVDLNRFDADHGGKGVLEVSFCVTESVARSMLHIWYGVYPFRKALPLVGTDAPDLALGPGCYVRYFSPEDALCAAFDPRQPLPASADGRAFPVACVGPAPQFYTWKCNGHWGDADPSCVFDYDKAPLWITVENCVGHSSTTVSIESVNYLADDCSCMSDDQCRATSRPVCVPARAKAPFCSTADPRCAGVCAVSR